MAEYRRRYARANRHKGHDARRKRRATTRGAEAENIDSLVVLEMDDGVRGICGEDVDPLAFDIDHILSLRAGGSHTYDNVQVSHPKCNREKGR